MAVFSEVVGVSALGASRLVPQPLQNWASDGLSRPQFGQSMMELPSSGEQAMGDDTSGFSAGQVFLALSGEDGSRLRSGESRNKGRLFSPRFSIGHLHRGILPFSGGPTMRWGLPSAGPILNVQIKRLSGGVFSRPK